MKVFVITLFVLLTTHTIVANDDIYRPKVPKEIHFAGMRLKLTDAARKDIQIRDLSFDEHFK